MKTAEETLQEFYLKTTKNIASIRNSRIPEVYKEGALKAMKAYAKAAIEEQLKVTAKEAVRSINEYLELISPSIGEEDILETTRIELK